MKDVWMKLLNGSVHILLTYARYVWRSALMALYISPCYPTISSGISCRPGLRVKGIARQLVKRIIPAYVTRLMLYTLLNHCWSCCWKLVFALRRYPPAGYPYQCDWRSSKHENVEKSSESGSIKRLPPSSQNTRSVRVHQYLMCNSKNPWKG